MESTPEHETAEIVWMIRQGSAEWMGPSPRASQARWARPASSGPRVWGGLRLAVAAAVFTGLILLSVTMVAVDVTPGGFSSVPRMVSDGLRERQADGPASPGPATASPSPAPSPTATPSPHTTPGRAGSATAPWSERPTPTPLHSSNLSRPNPSSPSPWPSPRDE